MGLSFWAQAISYPLPPKLLFSNTKASICNHCAILFIRVDEVPKPQFLGNVSRVETEYPSDLLMKSGFNKYPSCKISIKVFLVDAVSSTVFFLEISLNEKVSSNQMLP